MVLCVETEAPPSTLTATKGLTVKKATLLLMALSVSLAWGAWIEQTIDAPAGLVSGLAWEDGNLWAVDQNLDKVYEMDPSTGDVISSFDISIYSTQHPTGLAVENGIVYVGTWSGGTTGYVYKYDLQGGYLGVVSMCGG
jgi:outer membrane protein assembly factor BamB